MSLNILKRLSFLFLFTQKFNLLINDLIITENLFLEKKAKASRAFIKKHSVGVSQSQNQAIIIM